MSRDHRIMRQLVVRDLFAKTEAAPPPPSNHERVKYQPDPVAYKPPLHYTKVPCPTCNQLTHVPTLEVIIDWYDLPPQEEAIFRALWAGKGLPVQNERLIEALFSDDPNGGPSQTAAYTALKVAMSHLRKRLSLSGIRIENAGYRQGYRIRFVKEEH